MTAATPTADSKPKHTPGPWIAEPRDFGAVVVRTEGERRPIAEIWHNGHDPVANGNLVAASPDFMAAAEAFVAPYADLDDDELRDDARINGGRMPRHLVEAILAFRAAIRAAQTGER